MRSRLRSCRTEPPFLKGGGAGTMTYAPIFPDLWLLQRTHYLSPLDGSIRPVPALPEPRTVGFAAAVSESRAVFVLDSGFVELWESRRGGYERRAKERLYPPGLKRKSFWPVSAAYAQGDRLCLLLEANTSEYKLGTAVTLNAETLAPCGLDHFKAEELIGTERRIYRTHGIGGAKYLQCGEAPERDETREVNLLESDMRDWDIHPDSFEVTRASEPWAIFDDGKIVARLNVGDLRRGVPASADELVPQACRSELPGLEAIRIVMAAGPALFLTNGEQILDRWPPGFRIENLHVEPEFWWAEILLSALDEESGDYYVGTGVALRYPEPTGTARETTLIWSQSRGPFARPGLGGSILLMGTPSRAAGQSGWRHDVVAAHAGRCAGREHAAAAAAAAALAEAAPGADWEDTPLPLVALRAHILQDAEAWQWRRRADGWEALLGRAEVTVVPDQGAS